MDYIRLLTFPIPGNNWSDIDTSGWGLRKKDGGNENWGGNNANPSGQWGDDPNKGQRAPGPGFNNSGGNAGPRMIRGVAETQVFSGSGSNNDVFSSGSSDPSNNQTSGHSIGGQSGPNSGEWIIKNGI